MVKHALAREPQTSFTLIYGNRNPETILFREELEDLKDRHLGRFTLLHALSHNEESGAPLFEGRITADKVRALAATPVQAGRGGARVPVRARLDDQGCAQRAARRWAFAARAGASRVLRAGGRGLSLSPLA